MRTHTILNWDKMTIEGLGREIENTVKYDKCDFCKEYGRTILVARNPSSLHSVRRRMPKLRLCIPCRVMFLKKQWENYQKEHTYPSAMFMREKKKRMTWMFQKHIEYKDYR